MKTITHTRSFDLNVPIAELFPLFSPEGERRWVPGWDYLNIMGHTDLQEDYVFVTESHDHAGATAVWVVKRYEPNNHFVQFYKVEPGDKLGVVSVRCQALGSAATTTEVSYQYVALSDSGERFISEFDAGAYDAFIGEWQQLLTSYFEQKE